MKKCCKQKENGFLLLFSTGLLLVSWKKPEKAEENLSKVES